MRTHRITFCTLTALFIGILSAAAQSPLRFDETAHDFGTIAEDGGAVAHVFRFTNVSSEPLVIVNASASCGCTKAEFSRKPVKPNATGEIVIRFDPMNYPGMFARKVTILTSAGRLPEQLTVSGRVTPRIKTVEERCPLSVGGGVRMDANAHAFGYIEHGNRTGSAFEIVNTSDMEVSVQIIPTQESGFLEIRCPERLAPHEESSVNFAYALADDCATYGTLHDVLAMEIDGKRSEYPLTISAIAIDNRDIFADNGEPKVELSENFIRFEPLKRNDPPQSRSITIYNRGEAPLHIRRIETEYGIVAAAIDGDGTIGIGGRGKITVTLCPKERSLGPLTDRVRIITDDPHSPMRSVRVSALIESSR